MHLLCKLLVMTKNHVTDHRTIWLGVSLCVVCLGYFFVLDRVFFSSARFSPIFRFLLTADGKTAWVAAAISALAMIWNRPVPILRFVEFMGERVSWVALTCVVLLAAGATTVYHNYPLSMDEYAAVFQSKIFASGHLSAHLPPNYIDWMVVRGFNGEFLVASHETGMIVEKFWPGFALLLAPFEFLHMRWLCNALLTGVSLFLIHWITQEITQDKRAAGWATLFAIASGGFIADGISYYSMQAHLTANLLFAALLLRPTRSKAFGAGLVGSLALILHNPVPHMLFAIPWLTAVMVDRRQWRFLGPLLFGYLPGLGLGLGWVAFRADISAANQHLIGFDGIANGVFTWPNEVILNMRAASFVKMCIWTVPCLFVFAVVGFLHRRQEIPVRLLASSAILTFAGYFFVTFDQGHGWGNRYFQSAWGVIPILAACAMTGTSERSLKLVSFAGVVAILNLFVIVPFQMNQIEGFISQHLAQLGPPRRPGNNVYFIHPSGGFYVADMVQIDPFLRAPDLLLASRGAELDSKLIRRNWPNAVNIGSDRSYDQWYLGPQEHRSAMPSEASKKFVLQSVSE
jgi:hypothetical protein